MKNFLKIIFGSMIGTFVAIFITSMLFIVFFAFALNKSFEKQQEKSPEEILSSLKENTILEINLDRNISEHINEDLGVGSFLSSDVKDNIILDDIKKAVTVAKENEKIIGINLIFDVNSNMTHSNIYSLYNVLEDFKSSGKFIHSYSDVYPQDQYLLSSMISDSIFVNPEGKISFIGFGTLLTFYKGVEEKYGIKYDVIKHGKYKSAVEPYIRKDISEENREQLSSLLNDQWSFYIKKISKKRNISIEDINRIADYHLAMLPRDAKKLKIIDSICYKSDFEKRNNFNKIKFSELKNVIQREDISENKIAVLHAKGDIIYNKKSKSEITDIDILEQLKKIKDDPSVKALVLRVNSPGGDALASAIIHNELKNIKSKMPIVVSMGRYAASGGYYISSASDYIFAEPTTITGSIGVFGMLPNLEKFANKNGITTDIVQTNKNSISYSFFRGVNAEAEKIITRSIENTYNSFINVVAENRKISVENVDKIAQGRVWTGNEAVKINLVDEIGGLEKAIEKASELAKLDKNFNIIRFPEEVNKFEYLIDIFSNSKADVLNILFKKIFNIDLPTNETYSSNKEEYIYARIPFNLDF